jgi:nicotinamidase-related amidase
MLHDEGYMSSRGGMSMPAGERNQIVERIVSLIEAVRGARRPTIIANWEFRDDYLDCCLPVKWQRSGLQEAGALIAGSWGAQTIDALPIAEQDFLISAKAFSVFEFTHADRILRNCGVETCFVVGGPLADGVDDTVRQACAFGYRVVVVSDAVFPAELSHLRSLRGRIDAVTAAAALEMISLDSIPRPGAPGAPRLAASVAY